MSTEQIYEMLSNFDCGPVGYSEATGKIHQYAIDQAIAFGKHLALFYYLHEDGLKDIWYLPSGEAFNTEQVFERFIQYANRK